MGIVSMDDLPFAPEPNRELVRRLQETDPNLGLKYLPMGEGCWAMTEKWGPDDPRRERIRVGELAPNKDFDVLGFAPADATADDAFAILQTQLRKKVTEKPAYNDILNKVIALNLAQQAKNAAPVREFARELVSANEETIGTKVISRSAGFEIVDGKVVSTPKTPKLGLTKSERDAKRGET